MKPVPVKMLFNRVWRLYLGGRLLDEFCGNEPAKDGNFPEDWLASVTDAKNPPYGANPPQEGLSKVQTPDGLRLLKELIESNPEAYLGEKHVARYGTETGFLVKFLDSCERLPIQVHPDKKAARNLFGSEYGKTEAWHILGGRTINGQEPYILLGFRKPITRERWKEIFEAQDVRAMVDYLHKVPVRPGETYLIEGGTPHAIGPGCFLLEIQEPTDYTLHIERETPSGREVPDIMIHQGIGTEKMFDCFHYESVSMDILLSRYRMIPSLEHDGHTTRLISHRRTPCFALYQLSTESRMNYTHSTVALLVAVEGSGQLLCGDTTISLRRGESVFVPAVSDDITLVSDNGKRFSLLECLPPQLG